MSKRKILFVILAVVAFTLVAWYWWSRYSAGLQTAGTGKVFTKEEIETAASKPADLGLAQKNPYTKEQIDEIISRPMPVQEQ